eukprot:GFKZ01006617.1.p1 GENE.GFKZ01006617.1~~GFKZ01006617.1.p1  ORF type:complete len:589 (+),score=72.82 GFKZ01006617.1:121-1887(+)
MVARPHGEGNQELREVTGNTGVTNNRRSGAVRNSLSVASEAENELTTDVKAREDSESQAIPSIQNGLSLEDEAWKDITPGLFLDSFTFYLTPCAFTDKTRHAPLRAKAIRLLSFGGGSLSDELTPRVNYIVIIRHPIMPAKVAEIEYAQKMGVAVVSLAWLERCVTEQQLLEDDNPPLSEWLPDNDNAQVGNGSQAQHHADFESSLFRGMRCALGPLALYNAGLVAAVRQKLQRGRAKVLAHDARGVVSSGVATHMVCGDSLSAGAKRLVEAARARNRHVVVVTADWIDSCLHRERLVRVETCVLFSPVPHETPLRDMLRSKVSVTISGHQQANEKPNARRDVLARLARLLGAGYSERMTKGKTTHLIADGRSNSKSKKVAMANRWGIYVVNFKWLLACAQTGVVVDPTDFPVEQKKETPRRESEAEEEGDAEEKSELQSTITKRADNSRRRRKDLESTKKSLFKSPTASRRSPRFKEKEEHQADNAGEPVAEPGDKLFERFTELLKSSAGVAAKEREPLSPPATRRRPNRSPSVSLELPEEGQKQWSLDASQSQVIVHRDLTPPPTQGRGAHTRNLPPRAAKRRRPG